MPMPTNQPVPVPRSPQQQLKERRAPVNTKQRGLAATRVGKFIEKASRAALRLPDLGAGGLGAGAPCLAARRRCDDEEEEERSIVSVEESE
ncbi:hypothetical protein EYF80_027280 [Liparis tanakae]|uniref:Uncharacterized protein n=1 Tax=Liparis tanakae TaxID=230148 RepID=A0A4Z2H9A7_9TELE|nr:hypothetical protein EYF80_027280 [Liparis tanakae]